ncbi:MAG: indole-3-glycerol phosphate synthase [Robiginitomaculum sp.]|nr:MAG: indole-3-glycerol phosphate synthase [Robiginitomaculum sp.]
MSVLDDIVAAKRLELVQAKAQISIVTLQTEVKHCPPTRGFAQAIHDAALRQEVALIAEIKKASPSKGLIRANFCPATHAKEYQLGGATCLSVLTDIHFMGTDAHFTEARNANQLPMLRKDFMIDPWQILQSRQLGADCVLLIMAILSDAQAAELQAIAQSCQLDVLVETHDLAELDRALQLPATCLIGVNNRNLHNFNTDLQTTDHLLQSAPKSRTYVSESGIHSPADVKAVTRAGAVAILVGESLMRQENLADATRHLLAK